MTPERWQQITNVFESALRRGAAERAAFLSEACGGDEELRGEVEALLESHERAGGFMEEPALAVAARQGGDGASLAGQTVEHYQVLSLLGSGGMGDVYLALDTRLGRRVALKLLPDYLAGDARRAALFTKEARAASALNHPNIVTVYDIGRLGGRYYIAMEYVEGVSLRELIHRDRAPLAKLLGYLQQVAEGLTKAHAAGIVHRDLKPDNIMVTRDGYAKVLDFGLAKLVEPTDGTGADDAGEAATALMSPQSLPGMVMGTVGYMSPEQAQGRVREIDHRSDIFSFGCILYEAATGRKAFEGADVLDSLHKVVHAPAPQVTDAWPGAPDSLQRIVRRCLAKDPEKRYHSIKDVAIELEELQQELRGQPEFSRARFSEPARAAAVTDSSAEQTAPAAHTTAGLSSRPVSSTEYLVGEIKRHRTGVFLVAAALAVAAVVAGLLLLVIRQGQVGGNQAVGDGRERADLGAPVSFERMKLTRLTTTGKALDAAVSPDGKYVAYTLIEKRGEFGGGTAGIWIRQVATGRNIMIVEPKQFVARGLTFSPDSNYLYYRVSFSQKPPLLYRVPVLGGDAQKVADKVFSAISFSPDGKRLAFVRNDFPVMNEAQLVTANADGTDERIIMTYRGPEMFANPARPTAPAWSPDGKVLACARGLNNGAISLLEVQVEGGAERQIGAGRWSTVDLIAWLADGSGLMLTARDQSSPLRQVWHVAYPSGETRRLTNDLNDYQGMSLSADSKTLVVVQTARETDLWLMPVGRTGEARALTSGEGKSDGVPGISWTPDGKLVYASDAGGNRDIWLLDVDRGAPRQLTTDERQDFRPVVTPDGRYIIFMSDRGGALTLWRMDIDGGNPRQLVAGPVQGGSAASPDGRWVIYAGRSGTSAPALWKVAVEGGEPVRLTEEGYWGEMPTVSPDGKQVAFQYFSVENNASQLSLGTVPLEGGPVTRIGEPPFRLGPVLHWTPDGRAIAYIDNRAEPGQLYALPVDGGPPRKLTDLKSDFIFWFDFSPDGKQLALARGTQTSDVVLITDFR
jgi:serine/threonine protein kinase/Tol biopolymer transport system component